jgi:SAM-dependent methyltransferase
MMSYHAAHLVADPRRATVWKVVARHLDPHVAPDAHVLELGAGYCDWINNVRAARRVAVDVWPELPAHAASGVEPVVLDISNGLPSLGEAAFDVVLASNLLEHFAPDAAAEIVSSVAKLLRPAGRFILIQPNFRYAWRRYFDDYTHRSIFTDISLTALLRARGFRIIDVRPRFAPYSLHGSRIPVAGWLVKAYLMSPFKPAAGQMLVIAQKETPVHVR